MGANRIEGTKFSRARIVAAFLFAPLVPAALAFALPSLFGDFSSVIGASSLLYGLPMALIFGAPLYFYFERKKWIRLWHVLAAGISIGSIIPLILISIMFLNRYGSSLRNSGLFNESMTMLGLGAGVGLVSAFAFWLIGIARSAG
jgi:hypothetical protein